MRTIDMEGRQDRLWGWPIFRFLKIWRQASLSYRQRLRVNGSRVYPQIIFDTLLFLSEKVLTVQHSLVGGRQIPKSPTPLRGALTGGRHQLLLGFDSPELVQAQNAHLRRAFVRRRTGSESARSSGQHSLAGGGRLPAPHFRRKDPSSEVAGGMKKANYDGMQILQVTVEFKRRRDNGI